MQNFLGTLSQFYDNATGLFGMPDISFSFVDGNTDHFLPVLSYSALD